MLDFEVLQAIRKSIMTSNYSHTSFVYNEIFFRVFQRQKLFPRAERFCSVFVSLVCVTSNSTRLQQSVVLKEISS